MLISLSVEPLPHARCVSRQEPEHLVATHGYTGLHGGPVLLAVGLAHVFDLVGTGHGAPLEAILHVLHLALHVVVGLLCRR